MSSVSENPMSSESSPGPTASVNSDPERTVVRQGRADTSKNVPSSGTIAPDGASDNCPVSVDSQSVVSSIERDVSSADVYPPASVPVPSVASAVVGRERGVTEVLAVGPVGSAAMRDSSVTPSTVERSAGVAASESADSRYRRTVRQAAQISGAGSHVYAKASGDHSSVTISEDAPGAIAARITAIFQPGSMVQQFCIVRSIGGGGMGRVFLAKDTDLDRLVAIKVLAVDPMTEDAVLRFHQEAKSAARLNHRNIVQVWQFGVYDGIPFIAFEFVDGENIRSKVQRELSENAGPMAFDVALSYAIQITGALIHARHCAVVHRDIKPSNILVTREGYVKLIDLGLARVGEVPTDRDLTMSGTMLGTFDYIAPEQAEDARMADCRSDIYSLGCTLFFMLTGRPPFGGTGVQKLLKHRDVVAPDVREFRQDLPQDAARLLGRMMAKSPASRFQTPEDLLVALTNLVDDHKLVLDMPADQFLPTPQAPWKHLLERHLPWIIPTIVVIVTAFVLQWLDRSVAVAPEELSPQSPPPVVVEQ